MPPPESSDEGLFFERFCNVPRKDYVCALAAKSRQGQKVINNVCRRRGQMANIAPVFKVYIAAI
jgi:hypothetical protein